MMHVFIRMKKFVFLIIAIAETMHAFSQNDDLLRMVNDSAAVKQFTIGTFKSSRVINGHSVEMLGAGVLDFRILHRFGTINQGISDLFGLDEARMRIGFDYGLTDHLSIGVGRSTLNKEFDGFIKYRLMQQSEGLKAVPLSLVLLAGTTINTIRNSSLAGKQSLKARMGYYYQLIAARKVNSNFSVQLSPTLVHRNQIISGDENDIYAVGMGARHKLSKRFAVVLDYFYVVNGIPADQLNNPLSIGIDIETGGHVFQLHFSNAIGMNERAFITETVGEWGKAEIRFGFNLSRVFTLKKEEKHH